MLARRAVRKVAIAATNLKQGDVSHDFERRSRIVFDAWQREIRVHRHSRQGVVEARYEAVQMDGPRSPRSMGCHALVVLRRTNTATERDCRRRVQNFGDKGEQARRYSPAIPEGEIGSL